MSAGTAVLIVAAGCFWSVELVYQRLPGVISTRVGYIGGLDDAVPATYTDVSSGKTGHAEAVEVHYDPSQTSAQVLLDVFFRIHDSTTKDRQGNDVGSQYRSAVWFSEPGQLAAFNEIKTIHSKVHVNPIVTEIHDLAAATFHIAEDYHQQYLQKGGQSSEKGDLTQIRCYGNHGPLKTLNKPHLRDHFTPRSSAEDL